MPDLSRLAARCMQRFSEECAVVSGRRGYAGLGMYGLASTGRIVAETYQVGLCLSGAPLILQQSGFACI